MLIPRFTIRRLIALTAACGLFFFVVSCAVQGSIWAIAVSASISLLVFCFFLFGLLFAVAVCATFFVQLFRAPRQTESPFAKDSPPPQIIPGEGR
ncbi:MAG: hypothetical protein MK179_13450 [Pirellulaceae bacterium]|nr:hypothetical protein [Pirellulaceae bacterium]